MRPVRRWPRLRALALRSAPGIVAAVALAVAAALLGLDAAHAVALGAAVLAVGWAFTARTPARPAVAAAGPEEGPGSRPELARLAWSLLEPRPYVQWGVRRRLRGLAAATLADRGTDLDRADHRERVDALLGPGVAAVLLADRNTRITLTRFERALTAVERLTDHPPQPSGSAWKEPPRV